MKADNHSVLSGFIIRLHYQLYYQLSTSAFYYPSPTLPPPGVSTRATPSVVHAARHAERDDRATDTASVGRPSMLGPWPAGERRKEWGAGARGSGY